MLIKNTTYKLLHTSCSIIGLLLFVTLLCSSVFALSEPAYADGVPGGNISDPVVRAVDVANPAVVRIITDVPSRLVVHFSSTNDVTFPANGSDYSAELSGSGSFISSHGDILTADHVVNPPHDSSLSQYVDTLAAADVTAYINQHGTQQVTNDQVATELESGQISSTPQYGAAKSEVFYSTAYTGPLSATTFQDVPASIYAKVDSIEKESSPDQKDTAIIHAALNDTPSIALGDSGAVQQQDELTIIGFPGNGDVGSSPTSVLTSSINKVIVSSLKTTDSDAPVIQVGGNVEHGDSGGPALNSSGLIVGIVSFGTSDANSPGSTSFLQASNSAKSLLQALNLDTTPGPFQKAWSQAFADYSSTASGHWHKAASELSQLQTNYPTFKAVTPYLQYAQQQAQNEKTTTITTTNNPIHVINTTSIPATVWTIGVLALVVILILVIVVLGFSRGRKKTAMPVNIAPGNANNANMVQPNYQTNSQLQQPQQVVPRPQATNTSAGYSSGMAAFGAPMPTSIVPPYPTQQVPVQQPTTVPGKNAMGVSPVPAAVNPGAVSPDTTNALNALHAWPCGHLNRPTARFCSVCGEPAPAPSSTSTFTRPVDQ